MHKFASALHNVPLFDDFDDKEIDEIVPYFKLVKIKNNRNVVKFNEEGELLYILKYGQVKVLIPNDIGDDDQVVATLGPGKYFGEMSLMTGEPVSATVKTSLDSEFLTLDREKFQLLLKRYSKLSYKISMILAKRLRERNITNRQRVLPEKVGVFADDDMTSARISCLLGLSLYLEGLDRVLILDIQYSDEDFFKEFGFVEAQEKLASYISTHDIGTELKSMQGVLYEYTHKESLINKIPRKQMLYESRYKRKLSGEKYSYLPGVYVLQVYENNYNNIIAIDHLSPLLGLVAEIYDVVILNVGSKVTGLCAKAISQSDMCLLIGEKRPDDLVNLGKKIHEISMLEDWNIKSPAMVLFPSQESPVMSFEDIKKIFEFDDMVIRNFPSSKYDFSKVSFKPDDHFSNGSLNRVMASIAREITGKTIGLALGGGGARGYAHIGALKLLEEEHIPIDIVAGSSMGSLIGAAYCMTGSAVETERIIRKELAEHPNIFDFTVPLRSFVRGKRISRVAKNIFGDMTFSDMVIPFYVVCVDLITGEEVIINDGPVHLAVMASSAIPGIFKPVRWHDKYLVDGSVINKVPANVLNKYKADLVISVNVTPDREQFAKKNGRKSNTLSGMLRRWSFLRDLLDEPSVFQIITRSLSITNTQMSRVGAQFTNFEIKPAIEKFDFLNFKNFDPIVKAGEQATRKNISVLKNLIFSVK
ncbi:MAG: patatin-like phospholipase family protein [Candidatus Auribacterota bacterium]|jgi:NTE family protein|nr:patatin-like phospholipase family protein [Candidatus Auribacterota bacterium]